MNIDIKKFLIDYVNGRINQYEELLTNHCKNSICVLKDYKTFRLNDENFNDYILDVLTEDFIPILHYIEVINSNDSYIYYIFDVSPKDEPTYNLCYKVFKFDKSEIFTNDLDRFSFIRISF